jgi:Tol biopolymer transport system component
MGTSRTTEGGGCYREDHSGCDLVTFHLNTTTAEMTDVQVLTSAPGGPEWFPAWSPGGSYVAYNQATDPGNEQSVQVINVETGASWLVLEDARYPAWSPDGDEILVARNLPPRKELTVLSVNTSGPTPTFTDNGYLTEEPMTQNGVVGDPFYIPNSDMIVYHYKTEGDPGSSTWVMDRSTGTTTDVSGPTTCGHAAARPDGQEIACGLAKNDQILSSQRDGATFGEMSPLFDTPSPAQYATHHAGYADCDWVSNSYFEWCGSNDVIIASAQCAVHDGPKGVMLFSRVFLLHLHGPNEVPTLFDLTAKLEEEFGETGLTSASASCRVISGALSP